ncbi:MAG: RsiG family protein [Mycobacteriales bacterium]
MLDPHFLDGISGATLTEVRQRRDEAAQEESDLSYLRRLLQGRIDILVAELQRRSQDGPSSSLVEELPNILADAPSTGPRGLGRHLNVEPSRADAHRRQVEALVADVDVSDVTSQSQEQLQEALKTFRREEEKVSSARRSVQEIVDACAAEIGRRYREGAADVADLLTGAGGLPSTEPSGETQ